MASVRGGGLRESLLTRSQQQFLLKLPRGRAFSTAESRVLFPGFSQEYVSQTLGRLAAKKALVKLKRGLYFVSQGLFGGDDYKLALAAAGSRGPYISFAAALNYHHLLEDVTPVVYVATRTLSARRVIGGRRTVFVALGDKCVGARSEGGVFIASRAKALFDCLLLPGYCGGMPALSQAWANAHPSRGEWKEFGYYLREFAPISLVQRAGFLFDALGLKPPKSLRRRMLLAAGAAKNIVKLDSAGASGGSRDAAWRVNVNMKVVPNG